MVKETRASPPTNLLFSRLLFSMVFELTALLVKHSLSLFRRLSPQCTLKEGTYSIHPCSWQHRTAQSRPGTEWVVRTPTLVSVKKEHVTDKATFVVPKTRTLHPAESSYSPAGESFELHPGFFREQLWPGL